MSTFTNPYLETPFEERRKVAVHLANSDVIHIEQIRSSHGTVTVILTNLFKKFINALDLRGINDVTHSKLLETFLNDCQIVTSYEPNQLPRRLDGSPTGGSDKETSKRDDSGRVKGRSKKVAGAKVK